MHRTKSRLLFGPVCLLVAFLAAAPEPGSTPPASPEGAVWSIALRDPPALSSRLDALAADAGAGDAWKGLRARAGEWLPEAGLLLEAAAPGRPAALWGFGPGEDAFERVAAAFEAGDEKAASAWAGKAGAGAGVETVGRWTVASRSASSLAAAAAFLRAGGTLPACPEGDDATLAIRPSEWIRAHRLSLGDLRLSLTDVLPEALRSALPEGLSPGSLLGFLESPEKAAKRIGDLRLGLAADAAGLRLRLDVRPGKKGLPFPAPTGAAASARALPPDADLYAVGRIPEEVMGLAGIAMAFLRPDDGSGKPDPLQGLVASAAGDAAGALSIGKEGLSVALAAGVKDESGMRAGLDALADAPADAIRAAAQAAGFEAKVEVAREARKRGGVEIERRTLSIRGLEPAGGGVEIPGLEGLGAPGLAREGLAVLSGALLGPSIPMERAVAGGCAVATGGADAPARMDAILDRLARRAGPPEPLALAAKRHGEDTNLLVAIPLERAFRDLSAAARRAIAPLPLAGGAAETLLPKEGEFEGEGDPLTAAAKAGPEGIRIELFVPAKPVARIAAFLSERRKRLLETIEKSGLPGKETGGGSPESKVLSPGP